MNNSTILLSFIGLPFLGYLLGSISFALLAGKYKKIDLRQHGSGNLGSTNVSRVLGKKWGYACFVGDVLKGLLPTLLAGLWLKSQAVSQEQAMQGLWIFSWMMVAAGCVLGHIFPLFLKFKGGKGVATSLGVLLGFWPYLTWPGLLAFAVWTVVWCRWRYVSLASIIAAGCFPLIFAMLILFNNNESWNWAKLWPLMIFAIAIAIIVIVKHRANIRRLIAGTENR